MFNITTGNILAGVLYLVYGTQSVIYNGNTYNHGQTFRGISSINTFTFSGTGTQLVYEISEFSASALILDENALDIPVFNDTTQASNFSIEFQQNNNDISFDDITALNGFSIELLDYPFYSFTVSETRL